MRVGCRDSCDGRVPALFQRKHVIGAAMSSSPLEWLRDGDEDVTTPALERRGDVLIAVRRAFRHGDEDVATPFWTGSGRESEGELHGGVFGGDGAVPEANDERGFGVGGVAEALGQVGGPVHEEQPKERILAFAEDDRTLTDDR